MHKHLLIYCCLSQELDFSNLPKHLCQPLDYDPGHADQGVSPCEFSWTLGKCEQGKAVLDLRNLVTLPVYNRCRVDHTTRSNGTVYLGKGVCKLQIYTELLINFLYCVAFTLHSSQNCYMPLLTCNLKSVYMQAMIAQV